MVASGNKMAEHLSQKQFLTVSGAATFNFGAGTHRAGASFTTSLPITLTGNGGSWEYRSSGFYHCDSGILSGAGGLNKIGSGTLSLRAADSFKGNACISAGTLSLTSSGSIASTPIIDILSGATFDVTARETPAMEDSHSAALKQLWAAEL